MIFARLVRISNAFADVGWYPERGSSQVAICSEKRTADKLKLFEAFLWHLQELVKEDGFFQLSVAREGQPDEAGQNLLRPAQWPDQQVLRGRQERWDLCWGGGGGGEGGR